MTKSAKTIDTQDQEKIYEKGSYTINYRTVLMTGDWTDSQIITLPETMMKEMVKSKIMNYTDLLAAFNDVSDKVWYGPMILIGMITWMEQLGPGIISALLRCLTVGLDVMRWPPKN